MPPVAAVVILAVGWEAGARAGLFNPIILPRLSAVLADLAGFVRTPEFLSAVTTSGIETLAGLALGAFVGFVLGVLCLWSRWAHRSVLPYVILLQSIPRISLAPLFLLWFGYGLMSKFTIAAAICFFPMFINTMVGFNTADQDSTTVFRSYGSSSWQRVWLLQLPAASPYIVAGLKTSATLALSGAIVAEFVSSYDGLGFLISQASYSLDTVRMFSVLIVLAAEGAIIYWALSIVERVIVRRRSGPPSGA